jgi:hypothetical protein
MPDPLSRPLTANLEVVGLVPPVPRRRGPNADRNLGALAREVRRTQLAVTKIENRL